ncbi:MAG: sugar-transfer associated ATP-grasp domain-containing protein [Agriterribacter sp.]
MLAKRFIYIPYYLLKTPWRRFFYYFSFTRKKKGFSILQLVRELWQTLLKYNAAPMDYFTLRFYELTDDERAAFACTGFMYEYQLKMNPKEHRAVLQDKIKFLSYFKDYSGRKWASINMLKNDQTLADQLIHNNHHKVVIKNSVGQAGKEVLVVDTTNMNSEDLIKMMGEKGYDLIESYVAQHDELMKLSSAALNTIRIVTQYNNEEVEVLLAFIRIGVHLSVDNLSAGNIGAPIDLVTGRINGPGVYIDITKPEEEYHPVTKVKLMGFQIPYWKECIDLVTQAAMLTPENRSIGWDVGITNRGPVLIEGNHNWNYLTQLPGKRGFRREFLRYSLS